MNELVTMHDGRAVTTTLAIAEGTENEHASVIKLVRTYLADLEQFGRVGFEIEPFETAGGTQQREVAKLNEQQATLVLTLMRNSEIVVRFKVRLVKAFYELAGRRHADPMQVLSDPAAMRGLLLVYTEKVLTLESTVAEQAPKVEALDRIASAEGSLCMRDAAKSLQVRPIDLKNWLIVNRWIYGRAGHSGWLAYQDRIQQGVMVHKVTTVHREDGTEKIVEQARITPKGMARIAESLQKKAA